MNRNDALVTAVVNGLIFDKVNNSVSFTAHDITREARAKVGPNVLVDHNDVKALVHSAYLNDKLKGYSRELDPSMVGPGGVAPWRYSAQGSKANTVGLPSTNHSTPTPSNNPILQAMGGVTHSHPGAAVRAAVQSAQAAQASGTSQVLSRSDNTLRVLKEAVNKAGFAPGDTVFATYSPAAKHIVITPNRVARTNDPNAVSRPYSVDVKQNVRINLSQLGAEKAKSFIAVPVNGQINISLG